MSWILYGLFVLFTIAFSFRIMKWLALLIYDSAPYLFLLGAVILGYLYLLKVDNGRNTQTVENKSRCSWNRADWDCGEISPKTPTGSETR